MASSSMTMHRHKAEVISNLFKLQHNKYSVLHWASQSPDLNPTEHLRDVVEPVNLKDLQEVHDTILS